MRAGLSTKQDKERKMALTSITNKDDIKLQVLIQNAPRDNDISNWLDITPYLPKPFNISNRLDESLDLAYITLYNTDYSAVFQPFLKVRIHMQQGSTIKYSYWYIAEDNVTKIKGINKYTHNISLIEETKILERIICDTRTVTQPLYTGDSIIQVKASFGNQIDALGITWKDNSNLPLLTPTFRAQDKSIQIPNCMYIANESYGTTVIRFINSDGSKTTLSNTGSSTAEMITIQNAEIGNYEIEYIQTSLQQTGKQFYYFSVRDLISPKQKISIKQVIDNILATYKPYRIDEASKWSNERISLANVSTGDNYVHTSTLENITAPEFSFGKMSLWEIFSGIGGKLHAIPRLKTNVLNTKRELYFERLDSGNYVPFERVDNSISESETQSNEQFCDKIDTNVDNLIDTENIDEGSIIEPFDDYYKTTRNDTGVVVVQETDSLIELQYGVERLIKVECGYLPNGDYVGDITPYIYEATEYNALSSYATAPPAKSFALYYTYGENKIRGLTFKPEQAWAQVFGLELFNYYAIVNIIASKLGKTPSAITQLFTNLYDIRFLQFRVTYIPRISARITQAKPLLEDNKTHSAITYNQTANLVSALAYGENLKGVVSRFGNKETHKVYYTNDLSKMIEIGMINRENKRLRVSQVNLEFYNGLYKQEVQYSLDFNRYSQFVGANNTLRLFEVSEKQIAQRETVYEEYAVLAYGSDWLNGTYSTASDVLISQAGAQQLLNSFVYGEAHKQVDRARFKGFDNSNNQITDYISLPAMSLGIGNSIYLNFRCEDNYSAGNKIVARESSGKYYDAQQYVPYCDYFGNIETLEFAFGNSSASESPTNFGQAWAIGNALPDYTANMATTVVNTGTPKRLMLKKDSREILNLTYQLHLIAENNTIVIGSGFARYNSLVSSQALHYSLYSVSENEISNFTDKIDISNKIPITSFTANDITTDIVQNRIVGTINVTQKAPYAMNAFAIIEQETGVFIFGVKKAISQGATIELPKIYFIRDFR